MKLEKQVKDSEEKNQSSKEILGDFMKSTLLTTIPIGIALGVTLTYTANNDFANKLNTFYDNFVNYFF